MSDNLSGKVRIRLGLSAVILGLLAQLAPVDDTHFFFSAMRSNIAQAASPAPSARTKPTATSAPASIRPIRTIRPVKTVAPLQRLEPIQIRPIRAIQPIQSNQLNQTKQLNPTANTTATTSQRAASAKLAQQLVEERLNATERTVLNLMLSELESPGVTSVQTIRLQTPQVKLVDSIQPPQVKKVESVQAIRVKGKAQLKPVASMRVIPTPKRVTNAIAQSTAKPAAYQCVTNEKGTDCKGSPFTPKPSDKAANRWQITPDPIHGRVVTPTPTVLPDHLQKLVDIYLQAIKE